MRDVRVKFRIPNLPQFADTEQNSDGIISDFEISVHNSRTSDDIGLKLRQVTN